jgi:acyl dehydratase
MHPAAGHMDVEIAREVGMPGAYDLGWMRANWLTSLIANWSGDWGFVRKINYTVRIPNLVGDTTRCKAKVVRKFSEGVEHLVEIEAWGENQRRQRNCDATFVVRLPSHSRDDQFLVGAK